MPTLTNRHTPPVDLADRADKAVQQLFGQDAPLTRSVRDITDALREDVKRISTGQTTGPTTLALVGRVGEGKSWLTRTFINANESTEEVNQLIQSGQNATDRSMNLTWLGSQHTFGKLSDRERFIKLSPQNLLDLGAAYLIADTPGYSDHDPSLETLSNKALMSSNIKLLATSISHIRDASLAQFVGSMDGSLILPIVRFRPTGDSLSPADDIKNDCIMEMEKWSEHAPSATILPAIFVPDAGITGDEAARQITRTQLSATLSPLIEKPETLLAHRESQLQQRMERTRVELAQALSGFRQRIGTPVERLDQLSATLPEIVQKEVIGDSAQLNIGIRSRFRADTIERTPAMLFPYRSLIGILGLTQGAWDRLIFTTLGSVPSLVMTAFHSVKSWTKTQDFEKTLRDQSRQRIRSLINDAYRDDIRNFSHALDAVTNDTDLIALNESSEIIDIQGLTGIEIESQEIIAEVIDRRRVSGFTLWVGGLLAFLLFWAMLLGPAIALYTQYFDTLSSFTKNWSNYPQPPATLWLTSFMLSLIPAGIISMIVMHYSCRRGRIKKASTEIQQRISTATHERISTNKVRLVINNPKLNAAKTLLNIGR